MTENTVHLKQSVTAHGETVTAITLREPKGKDAVSCGYPMRLGEGGAEPIAASIAKYISRLGEVPPSTVDQLGMEDFNALMAVVLGFFGESGSPEPKPTA